MSAIGSVDEPPLHTGRRYDLAQHPVRRVLRSAISQQPLSQPLLTPFRPAPSPHQLLGPGECPPRPMLVTAVAGTAAQLMVARAELNRSCRTWSSWPRKALNAPSR